MTEMSVLDFSAMVDESFVESHMTEYRLRSESEEAGELVGTVLVDMLDDGLSLIYSFYEPTLTRRSLGTYIVLHQIERAKALGLKYVYLGYWVNGSPKMGYKARFLPQERLTPDGWALVRR
jgi:leucyl-tRNA---protein transferase